MLCSVEPRAGVAGVAGYGVEGGPRDEERSGLRYWQLVVRVPSDLPQETTVSAVSAVCAFSAT